ncbi:MAG: [FeFe] hydrogenase H-cluster radical SAM maturase HydG [Defluviitaleaceae bacterium]|nr:[FeFe] hydrogenase H-cluster radical SAM maturase HydG [Defluviitaleaceae bacterium]
MSVDRDFCVDDGYIHELLERGRGASDERISGILDRAESLAGLSHEDVAALLGASGDEHWRRIFEIAGDIKRKVYGDRVVVFAPLYVSDYCVNNCSYCGFRAANKLERRRLSMDELREEVRVLEKMGHKRLALETGEDPENCPIEYVLECIREIYAMKFNNGEIRRINVNIGATGGDDYIKLKDAGIGTYILFQETYHRATYEAVHLSGPKADYPYHLTAFDRAMRAGLDDVGGGVLFGLYDHAFEVLALMLHNEHLEQCFGAGFHTISVPRIRRAEGNSDASFPHAVSDEDFSRIVAVIRLAVPYTGIILSTREAPQVRKALINAGVSQVSAGSRTSVGGYSASVKSTEQFSIVDKRDTNEVVYWLMEEGLVPSFCTACYRQGRTGDRFMELAKAGEIRNVCLPNALFTLKEYALDYGDERFGAKADELIAQTLTQIEDEQTRAIAVKNLRRLERGERDVFF